MTGRPHRMGSMTSLHTADGQTIGAYVAEPAGASHGGVVVLQEIFGVNAHIRDVADRYAAQGYHAVAPALFDRVRPGLELGYDDEGRKIGFATMKDTRPEQTLQDVQAAIDFAGAAGRVGVVGFCWGGTLAFESAVRLTGLSAAVGYYGGGIAARLDETPRVPVMLHFGEHDDHIPVSDVEKIRAAFPELPVFTYPAGHGFNCDQRGSYDRASADLALARTLPFLRQHVG